MLLVVVSRLKQGYYREAKFYTVITIADPFFIRSVPQRYENVLVCILRDEKPVVVSPVINCFFNETDLS